MPKKNELSHISILAKRYRCHPRTIRNWRDAGAPLDDPKALTVWLSRRRTVPLGAVSTAMRQARLWKMTLECERLNFRNAIARGEYVRSFQVQADMLRIGTAVRTALNGFVDAVPTWEGLPAAQMHKSAVAIMDSICADLHDSQSKLYDTPLPS